MKLVNDAHIQEYETKPEIVAKAPGRFHLIGEHSWFFKDKTLSMAVNLPVYVAVSKRNDVNIRFYFHQLNERKKSSVSPVKFKKEDRWANACKSVVYGLFSLGFDFTGFDLTIYSDILPSAGFGITTAIKVATLIALKSLYNLNCSDSQLLKVLEIGNKKFLKVENYLSNNYSALFSKKGNLIVTDYFKSTWDYAPFNFPGKKVFLVDTKVPRVSIWNENSIFEPENALLLGDLREQKSNIYGGWHYISDVTDINEGLSTLSEDTQRKLKSIIREHNDLLEAKSALDSGDFFKFARAVNHSHETMRDMFNISCPEIDWILKRVNELEPNLELVTNPVTCGRITGKGFGRCLFAIMRENDVEGFKSKLLEFEKIFGFQTASYVVEPADGATLVRD